MRNSFSKNHAGIMISLIRQRSICSVVKRRILLVVARIIKTLDAANDDESIILD
jgi:hypothetical protein